MFFRAQHIFLALLALPILAVAGCKTTNIPDGITPEQHEQVLSGYYKITDMFGEFQNVRAEHHDSKPVTILGTGSVGEEAPETKTAYRMPEAIFQFVPKNENSWNWSKRITFKNIHTPKAQENRNDRNERLEKYIRLVGSKYRGLHDTDMGTLDDYKTLKNKKAPRGIKPEVFAKYIFTANPEKNRGDSYYQAMAIYLSKNLVTTMLLEKKDEPITEDDVKGINYVLQYYMKQLQNSKT